MIERERAEGVRVTFTLETNEPVSVVGDFNGWDPTVHPLVPVGDGIRSVTIDLEPDTEVAFRYLADGGRFFDDADADRFDDNGHGETHSVLVVGPAAARKAPAKKTADKKAPAKKAPAKKAPAKKAPAKKAPAKKAPARKSSTG
jgi:hypothetical protein